MIVVVILYLPVVTYDLSLMKDAKLRSLIGKGPFYRDQNSIHWNMDEKECKDAVAGFKHRWLAGERVDVRVLNEWEHKVNERIQCKIGSLRQRHTNRRKKHVLDVGSI